MLNERQILELVKNDNYIAFSTIFESYYRNLVVYASIFVSSIEICEDIVQSVFLRLWENRHDLSIETSIKSYLYCSVKNKCLNELKHHKIRSNYEIYVTAFNDENYDVDKIVMYKDCKSNLNKALEQLPEKYRQVFIMSRYYGLKYKDISSQLGVSKRTVEDRMKHSIVLLKDLMKDFLLFIVLFAS